MLYTAIGDAFVYDALSLAYISLSALADSCCDWCHGFCKVTETKLCSLAINSISIMLFFYAKFFMSYI